MDWREKALELEAKVEELRSATARLRSEGTNAKAELVALKSLMTKENERRLRLDEEAAKESARPVDDKDRTMEIFALETQLVTTKVGLAQARFERDSLQAEVRQLRERLAQVARSSRKPLDNLSQELAVGNDEDVLKSVVAMRVGSVYQSGVIRARAGELKFYPSYNQALRRKEKVLEVFLTALDRCTIEEESLATGSIAPLLGVLELGRLGGELYQLMGFRWGIEVVRMHLAERMRAEEVNPMRRKSESTVTLGALPETKLSGTGTAETVAPLSSIPRSDRPDHAPVPKTPPAPKFTREMSNQSEVLEPEVCAELVQAIPSRFRTEDWQMLYSTSHHGYSLQTFLTLVGKHSPTLICLRDADDYTFGCYASSPWKHSLTYYGSGETFLFTTHPTFEVYKWTRTNAYFQLISSESMAVGGGGHFGLWIDSSFNTGTSGTCETFQNEPLSPKGEFRCMVFEAWTFVQKSQLKDATQFLKG